jgi:hypothetical protein
LFFLKPRPGPEDLGCAQNHQPGEKQSGLHLVPEKTPGNAYSWYQYVIPEDQQATELRHRFGQCHHDETETEPTNASNIVCDLFMKN